LFSQSLSNDWVSWHCDTQPLTWDSMAFLRVGFVV
jgi:hypothetical protein